MPSRTSFFSRPETSNVSCASFRHYTQCLFLGRGSGAVLAEVKWLNENLLFIRPWWGRIAATDLIYDVEAEKVIHSEGVMDAYLALLQYRASCPLLGCECIKNKSE